MMTPNSSNPSDLQVEAENMKSDFFSPTIVHDFNNLLTIISMNIETALQSLPEKSSQYTEIQSALNAVEKASFLANKLLEHSKKQAEKKGPFSKVHIPSFITHLQPMFQRILGDHILLKIHERTTLPFLEINTEELENCLLNLILNARDAMDGQGTLTIRLGCEHIFHAERFKKKGDASSLCIHMQVSDTGKGISGDDLPHIFNPFYTTKTEGRGLGLVSVLDFVKKYEGFIDVETGEDIGTTFHLYFPIAEEG